MRYTIFLFLLLPAFLWGQYPNNARKQRLGYQTTGAGLVYIKSGAPSHTPADDEDAWMVLDTTNNALYYYDEAAGAWENILDDVVRDTVFRINSVPDTSTIVPLQGDLFINATADTLGAYDPVLGWQLFVGGDGNGIYSGSGIVTNDQTYAELNSGATQEFGLGYFPSFPYYNYYSGDYGLLISPDENGTVTLSNQGAHIELLDDSYSIEGRNTLGSGRYVTSSVIGGTNFGSGTNGSNLRFEVDRSLDIGKALFGAGMNGDSAKFYVGMVTETGVNNAFGVLLNPYSMDASSATFGNYMRPNRGAGFGVIQNINANYYDWLNIDFNLSDTSQNAISLYNDSYSFPNATPSTTLGDTTVMAWRGTGSAAEAVGFVPYGGGGGGSGTVDHDTSAYFHRRLTFGTDYTLPSAVLDTADLISIYAGAQTGTSITITLPTLSDTTNDGKIIYVMGSGTENGDIMRITSPDSTDILVQGCGAGSVTGPDTITTSYRVLYQYIISNGRYYRTCHRPNVNSITSVADTTSIDAHQGDAFINTSADTLGLYSGSGWVLFYGGGGGASQTLTLTGDSLSISGGNTIDVRPDWYNVRDFGAIPDDGTDDTAEIQAAIDACFDGGGGTVFFPKGIYNIDDTLRTSVSGENPNGQIYIPQNTVDSNTYRIKLLGEIGPALTSGGLISLGNPITGVILLSSITGSGSYPSVISVTPGTLFGLNRVLLEIENITVKVPANTGGTGPTMCGINAAKANQCYVKNVRVDIDNDFFTTAEPQNEVFGLRMPNINNGTRTIAEKVLVGGFRYGVISSEHTELHDVEARVCYYAFALEGADHAQQWGRVKANWNKHALLYDNTMFSNSSYNAYICISQLDIETIANGKWYANAATNEIIDGSNKIYGEIKYHVVRSSVGEQNNDWSITGAENLLHTPTINEPFQLVSADGLDDIDFRFLPDKTVEIDLSLVSNESLSFSNPCTAFPPKYRIHFTGVSTDSVTFPSNLYSYAGDQLGSRIITGNKFLECYYNSSDIGYYCSDTLGVSYTPYNDSTVVSTTSGLIVWYNVNAETEYSNGSNIDTLHDFSGLAHHISQDTTTQRPVFLSNVINSHPVARFDGTNDNLVRDSIGELASGNDFTIFIVGSSDQAESVRALLSTQSDESTSVTSGQRMTIFADTRSTTKRHSVFSPDTGDQYINLSSEISNNTFFTFSLVNDFTSLGGDADGFINGTQQGSTLSWSYTADSYENNYLSLGSQHRGVGSGTQLFLDGDIAEVIIYNRALSGVERADIENYLQGKYGHY